MRTVVNSDLKWKVYKVHHIGENYVKLKALFFYKGNGNVCFWLNPMGEPKNFKVLRSVYDNWESENE